MKRIIKWELRGKCSVLTPAAHLQIIQSLPEEIPGLELTSASGGSRYPVDVVSFDTVYFKVTEKSFNRAMEVLSFWGDATEDNSDKIFDTIAPWLP